MSGHDYVDMVASGHFRTNSKFLIHDKDLFPYNGIALLKEN